MRNYFNIRLILTVLLLCQGVLAAKHSDQFLLGVYSSLTNGSKDDILIQKALCRDMQTLGYNASLMNTNSADKELPRLLSLMDEFGLDSILLDFGWDPSLDNEQRFATYPLSISNYMKFEAEFSSEEEVKKGDGVDSQFWYAARNMPQQPRAGRPVEIPEMSYGWGWEATSRVDKEGYLFTDLRYRWPNPNGAYVRFGDEFTLNRANPSSLQDESVWVNYRFKINSVVVGLLPDQPLLRFYVAGFELSGDGFSQQAKIVSHLNKDSKNPETIYRAQDHANSPSPDGFMDIQLKIPYAELIAAKLLTADTDLDPGTPDSRNRLRLINFNPRVYWYGNCDVQLDYVEVEDQAHHDLRTNHDWWAERIVGRMRRVISQASGNLRAFYTWDEPQLGQFDSFRLLQDMAAKAGTKLMTAVFDYQRNRYALEPNKGVRYDHVDAFLKLANPRIISPDIYPITPEIGWNTDGSAGNSFIQNVLDDKMLRVYRNCKLYRNKEQGREFLPIVQVLGNWMNKGGTDQWVSWIQPPTATQKALLYLPLCYGPDGIIHYSLRKVQSPEGYGHRVISYSRQGSPNYPYPERDPIAWPAVESSNSRVKQYGSLIRDLTWLEAESVGIKKFRGKAWHKTAQLSYIRVKQSRNGDYEGYVQCGYYQDNAGNPWFMVVNRRGNYFRPGAISNPSQVPAEQFGSYFPEAEPQTLVFKFDSKAVRKYGRKLALHDPVENILYVGNKGLIEISIPAGEGRLLRLVEQ
ncbi:MAG: hypothetical protein KBA54_00095 [Candidatus Cloacimonetes bacterium]|nr:hypothetical protein [Candidatus Cloacimonadota bacterium]